MTRLLYILSIYQTQSIFSSTSPGADKIVGLDYGFLIAGSAILILVIALTTYITIRFRAKTNDAEPKQVTGSRKLEILMVGVPLVLVIVFFFWSLNTMNFVNPDHGNKKPDVIITGHQWWWQVAYPGLDVVTANEIHLPTGKKLLLQLNSADVIHDWWVPSLGAKMDMIPGTNNYLSVTINKPGLYEGTCSEFCGEQHAWMRITVIAQSQADYNKWLTAHALDSALPVNDLARKGRKLFMKASCSSCHSIRGSAANGNEGPDLTHFASRKTMLSGMMDNNYLNIYKWLQDPQKVKPGARMPRFIFNSDSLRALTTYLTQLK